MSNHDVRQTQRSLGEGTIAVHYLHSHDQYEQEVLLYQEPRYFGLASGMERKLLREAAHSRSHGLIDHATLLSQRALVWQDLADRTWGSACRQLAQGLPSLDAYVVVPSSRSQRRDELVAAMRTQHARATELFYAKRPGVQGLGELDETDICDSLQASPLVALSELATVAIVDDWMGRGATLRGVVRRVSSDYPGLSLRFVGAFPGITKP